MKKEITICALALTALLLTACGGHAATEPSSADPPEMTGQIRLTEPPAPAEEDAPQTIAEPADEPKSASAAAEQALPPPAAADPQPSADSQDSKTGNLPSSGTAQTQLAAHTHSYRTQIVAPTCTEGGCTVHTCACGDSYRDGNTPALGHAFEVTVVAPTTAAEGYTLHTCSRCGASVKDALTPKLEPPAFDIDEYVTWAQEYAVSIGLTLDESTKDGWDPPMVFTAEDVPFIKQWIMDDLRIHLREGDTATWIWAEDIGGGAYEFFTGRG